ncbi:hypothetical protein [uncultured Pontibacter sp.]|uniref:hypothetical protein n=1 Tax=uncultured Pontibacter sp. TaxID=453356 RepID=UPI0026352CCC|nr:hypothetical protein [uncultured Pontibacter sp.]
MNSVLYRIILAATLGFAAVTGASAQFAAVDIMGHPIQTKSYTDVKGSAYLYDTWMKGSATTANGITYDGVELMYDQVSDELLFRSENGEAKTFFQPISEFSIRVGKDEVTLKNHVFRKGFTPVDAASPHAFYQVLVDGDTQLLKRTSKKIFEELPYGSATKVKTFQEDTHYYIAQKDKLTKIKTDKRAVLKALNDKEAALETYIKANRLNLKNDEDLIKVIDFYNAAE